MTEQPRAFEDLTLSELLWQFFRAPVSTAQTLIDFAQMERPVVAPVRQRQRVEPERPALSDVEKRQRAKLGLYITAFMLAFWGCVILVSAETRFEASQLRQGTPFLVAGFLMWLGAEIYAGWPQIKARFRGGAATVNALAPALEPNRWSAIHPIRLVAALGVVLFAFLTWVETAGNVFRTVGFWAWLMSIVLVLLTFVPASWTPENLWRRLVTQVRGIRLNWTLVALVVIMLIGAYFRLNDLAGVPPEMTSDHIEKLLDSQRVLEGDRDIFFRNNGGREPFQMYAMALLSYLPGFGIDFTSLKLLAVFESLLTIPVLWWLGREVVGERNRELGNVVGLILAALIAVSYWHVAITRLSLRIVLTPLVMSLLLIFLIRGMRSNRRGEFILAGLTLGFGLYTYQAVRMMPLVVLAGVGLAILAHIRNRRMVGRYIQNLAVLVAVSFIIFVPLFRFSVDFPDAFWMRAAGRLLGDDVIQETDEFGNIVERNATLDERLDAFEENLGVLTSNIRNALLMFNWKGDVGWISGVPNYPVMDSFTGGLLIIGLGAWLALIFRRPDPVYILIPLSMVIMLLPSALSIAAPLENPSATRASGAIPPAYLLAALPLALIALLARDLLDRGSGRIAAVGVVVIVVLGAFAANTSVYFNDYRESYLSSWRSHSYPGQVLRGFANSDGSYGNAFILHFPHWLDHRIVGLEAGIIDWDNAIADQNALIAVERIPEFIYDAWICQGRNYPFDPDKDLLVFYHVQDDVAESKLEEWFPGGRIVLFEAARPNDEFKTYRVPALGTEGWRDWLAENTDDPHCIVG